MSTKMQRDDLQDKAQLSGDRTPEVCPVCGGVRSDFGCRKVPAGDWCSQQLKLLDDPRRILTSVQADPLREQIEADERVQHARAKHEQLQAEADQADAEWQRAAYAAYAARQQRSDGRRQVVVGGRLQDVVPPGAPTPGAISRLEEAATQLNTLREFAAEKAIAARIELDGVRQWVRVQLDAVQQVEQIRQQYAPTPT
jgi:hypothetical protein